MDTNDSSKVLQGQIGLDLIRPEEPSLENFIVGENKDLFQALTHLNESAMPQFFYLWGGSGVGKTHLLKSLLKNTERVPAFKDGQSLYVVDDVDLLGTEELQSLFVLMNAVRAHPATRLVVTGHSPAHELALREDIKSRLTWGLSFEVKCLDEVSARTEFTRLAKSRGIEITADIEHWIATHAPRDMMSLRRLLDAIDQYSIEKKRKVTLPLLVQFTREEELKK